MSINIKRIFLASVLLIAATTAFACVNLIFFRPPSLSVNDAFATILFIETVAALTFLCMFAAYSAFDRPGWNLMAAVGTCVAPIALIFLIAFAVSIANDWLDYETSRKYHLANWAATLAAAAALLCLAPWIGAPRMKPPARRFQFGALASLFAFYALLLIYFWSGIPSEPLLGVMELIMTACACCTLAAFTLHQFLALKHIDPLSTVSQTMSLRCPRCLKEQQVPLGQSQCAECQLRFNIQVEEPHCPACGYNLHKLTSPNCPECGRPVIPPKPPDPNADLLAWPKANDQSKPQ